MISNTVENWCALEHYLAFTFFLMTDLNSEMVLELGFLSFQTLQIFVFSHLFLVVDVGLDVTSAGNLHEASPAKR